MPGLTNYRVIVSPLMRLMIVSTTLIVGFTSQEVIAQSGYQNSESIRSDTLTVLELHRTLQQDFPGQVPAGELSLAQIERAIIDANELTNQELNTLQRIDFSLAPAIANLQALEDSVTAAKIQIEYQAKTATSIVVDDCDGYVGDDDDEASRKLIDPPGPCGQINYQPTNPPLKFSLSPVVLSDNAYPDFLACTQYQHPLVVFAVRAYSAYTDVVATVARRICDQIYTAAGVGANGSLVCLISDAVYLVAKGVKENIGNCQTYRVASEGSSTYVRAGELFMQSRQNTDTISRRSDEEFTKSSNGLNDILIRVNENSRKIEQTNAKIDEVMKLMLPPNIRNSDAD